MLARFLADVIFEFQGMRAVFFPRAGVQKTASICQEEGIEGNEILT